MSIKPGTIQREKRDSFLMKGAHETSTTSESVEARLKQYNK